MNPYCLEIFGEEKRLRKLMIPLVKKGYAYRVELHPVTYFLNIFGKKEKRSYVKLRITTAQCMISAIEDFINDNSGEENCTACGYVYDYCDEDHRMIMKKAMNMI